LPDRTSTLDIGFHFHKASPILSTSFTLATLRSATPSLPLRAHPRLLQPIRQPYRQRYWENDNYQARFCFAFAPTPLFFFNQ
jgi:hypothetical protein